MYVTDFFDNLSGDPNCDVDKTKEAILKALGVVQVVGTGDDWVTVDMAIVKDSILQNNMTREDRWPCVNSKLLLLP